MDRARTHRTHPWPLPHLRAGHGDRYQQLVQEQRVCPDAVHQALEQGGGANAVLAPGGLDAPLQPPDVHHGLELLLFGVSQAMHTRFRDLHGEEPWSL